MFWLILSIIAILLYTLVRKKQTFWKNLGVPQTNSPFLIGDIVHIIAKKETLAGCLQRIYRMFPESRYVGLYQSIFPTLLIRDPDLIKQIAVKDVEYFMDHQLFVPEHENLWSRNVFSLKGEEWRAMRTTLTPTFTSAKLKGMFPLISECAGRFVTYFKNKREIVVTVEIKDEFRRFATDVIATCAYGLNLNTLQERENEFYEMGKSASEFSSFWKVAKFFGYAIMPNAFKFFGVQMFPSHVADFFKDIVLKSIKLREEKTLNRPDMIHLLMEAKKGCTYNQKRPKIKLLTDDDIVGQTLIFFIAGYETIATQMTFTAYELALNQDVQERLINEIDTALKDNSGEISYALVKSLKYLEMVTSESLRKWPSSAGHTDRVCTKPYVIQPKLPNERPILISKGTSIWFPISAINRDPKYFPNPDKFDPERFNDSNKSKIAPGTFIPFGLGARSCIGKRFATLELKIILVHLLRTFRIVKVEKTLDVIKTSPKSMSIVMEGGHWLGLQLR